jgi:hypothetical protein
MRIPIVAVLVSVIAGGAAADCIEVVGATGTRTRIDTHVYRPCAIVPAGGHEAVHCRREPPPKCLQPGDKTGLDCRTYLTVIATSPIRQLTYPRQTVCGVACKRWELTAGRCECAEPAWTTASCEAGATFVSDAWPGEDDGWQPSGSMPGFAVCAAVLAPPAGACSPPKPAPPPKPRQIFADDFETGDAARWSLTVGGL